jgi:hypothetical protein
VLAAALSRGPGYEAQPLGTRFDRGSIRGYYLDLSAKTASPWAAAPQQLVPAGRAPRARGGGGRGRAGDEQAMVAFEATYKLLLERAVPQGEALLWPYDMAVPKYGLSPPWFSAMAQGQAASVLVRAASRDESAVDAALRALRPLLDRAEPFVLGLPAGPVLEEVPTNGRSSVLNGWIYALWGVHDVAVGLDSSEAAALFAESLHALRATLGEYDTGWWSRYSLWAEGRDLAKPFYHRVHIAQLEALHRLTGTPELLDFASRWRRYDTRGAAARAVLVKGREVLAR